MHLYSFFTGSNTYLRDYTVL